MPIISYEFSNNKRFTVIATEDNRVKVFQHAGSAFNDARLIYDIKIQDKANKADVHITSGNSNRIEGYVAYGVGSDLCVVSLEGVILAKYFSAVDHNITGLKIMEFESNHYAVCMNRDGRFNVIKLNKHC